LQQAVALLGRTKKISFKNSGESKPETLSTLFHVVSMDWEPNLIKLHSNNLDLTLKHLFQLAADEDWIVRDLMLEDASMSDVFSELTLRGKEEVE
jgi:ABC-2 type transport system ATP-binding protein